MLKIISFLVCFTFIFTASVVGVFAQQASPSASPTPSTESAAPSQIDTFTLFWPLTAGKTKADSMYFLKRIKEDMRGFLIFSKPQKAEYKVFLATKRVLEADSLISSGKSDIASQSLDDAIENLDEATSLMDQSKDDPARAAVVDEMKNKLKNINQLLSYLTRKGSEPASKIQETNDKSTSLYNSI